MFSQSQSRINIRIRVYQVHGKSRRDSSHHCCLGILGRLSPTCFRLHSHRKFHHHLKTISSFCRVLFYLCLPRNLYIHQKHQQVHHQDENFRSKQQKFHIKPSSNPRLYHISKHAKTKNAFCDTESCWLSSVFLWAWLNFGYFLFIKLFHSKHILWQSWAARTLSFFLARFASNLRRRFQIMQTQCF